jgi:hypothetical protein
VRDDVVVRSPGGRAPLRRVVAATLAGGVRSPATEAMPGIPQEISTDCLANDQPPLAAAA